MPDELDSVLQRAVAALRLPVREFDGLDDRIMSAVRAEAASPRKHPAHRWAAARYTIRLSPLGALAAAAGIAAVLLGGIWAGRRSALNPIGDHALATSIATAPPRSTGDARTVRFEVAAPGAAEVTLVGDFNDWNPAATPLRASRHNGVWSVTVPIAPGRHEYAFVVDGERWIPDPHAPRAAAADFGSANSVVTVTERS
jgi:Carbohydrate-binding module 48 (Isoamylase N-terminal domain)